MGSLKSDLREGLELEETHISWVFLGQDEVWKVKKPVNLGFLDFSTPASRRAACEAEVRLNRRLAPDVYDGIVPVTRDGGGLHRFGGHPVHETVDWAVHMRRLPMETRADHLLVSGRLSVALLDRAAARLAAFHAEARCDAETASFGTAEAIAVNVRESFEQTRASIHDYLSLQEAAEIEAWQVQYLEAHAERFAARCQAGRVRDGHGDLRLEHLYFPEPGEVLVVDCIEFNKRFRYADVAADIAFLAMDLAWHGRADLAEGFLAAYAREADDHDLYQVVDFYESYRAYVRGKVATILAADASAGAGVRERAANEARRYFRLALAAERRPLLPPALVAVGGVIAAGKSTLARSIAAELAAPSIDADRTRKHLLGVAPDAPIHVEPWQDAYSEAMTQKVYDEVLRRAGVVLASGRPVVLDASFRARAHRRQAAGLAAALGVPFLFVECRTAPEVCRRRLAARRGGVSDGRTEIFDAFLANWEEVEELSPVSHLPVDGTDLDRALAALRERLPTWPSGLVQ